MNIFIRADASIEMGTGHIMRCLTLAERLREHGAKVSFISREHNGNLNEWIRSVKNFDVYSLPVNTEWHLKYKEMPLYQQWLGTDIMRDAELTKQILLDYSFSVDYLIVDHYGIDEAWEKYLRPYVRKIMVIDDLANRSHDCDLLLDQNFYENMSERYKRLVPVTCRKLFGPQYALLRKEFTQLRERVKIHKGNIKRRIFVFFGGSDPTNETMKALRAIEMLNYPEVIIDVVVGKLNPNKYQIESYCRQFSNINFYFQVENIAELMGRADLAIGAGGTTTWERACLGLPAIVVAIADNQIELCEQLSCLQIGEYIGYFKEVSTEDIYEALNKMLSNPQRLLQLKLKALQVVDGKGASRVITYLLSQ